MISLCSKGLCTSGIVAILLAVCSILAGGCSARQIQPLPSQQGAVTPGITVPPALQTVLQRETAIPVGAVKVAPETDAAPPILHSDEWQSPIPVPGRLNTAGAEDAPFITPDGSTLYFFFTPDLSVPPEKQLLDGVTGIYTARFQSGSWGQVERVLLQAPGKLALDGCPFVQAGTMWFCSTREGFTGIHFFTAQFMDGRWTNWQAVDDQFKPDYDVGELHITANERELYYHSSRPGGKGDKDIWVARWINDAWQAPEPVTTVNSAESEGWPFVSQDGNELWFTRMHMGSPAIYRSLRAGDSWFEPELIISQLAGEPSLDLQGNLYFVHHFIKDGKMVEADLYVAYRR